MDELIKDFINEKQLQVFHTICSYLNTYYEIGGIGQNIKGKWDYEYKFRKNNKTLCGFYFKQNCMGFMIILGQKERDKFEENREDFSSLMNTIYDTTRTYHDGKWLMLEVEDLSLFEDIKKLLSIKRKPKKLL